METWSREDLYGRVWTQPLVRVAAEYGISDVALGKICRRLQIPLPGSGYWAKKERGKQTHRKPLPIAKNLPVVRRSEPSADTPVEPTRAEPEPSDQEFLRIKEVESRPLEITVWGKRHPLVVAADRLLKHKQADNKGIVHRDWQGLDISVSRNLLDRALRIMDTLIMALEGEKFPVSVVREKNGTRAQIFGYAVPFAIVEKYREKSRREAQDSTWKRLEIEYEPSGVLEIKARA